MDTIHKFRLEDPNGLEIMLPKGAQVLTVQMQRHVPCLWVRLNTDAPLMRRRFVVTFTGQPLPDGADTYIGTFQIDELVFHLFEATKLVVGVTRALTD